MTTNEEKLVELIKTERQLDAVQHRNQMINFLAIRYCKDVQTEFPDKETEEALRKKVIELNEELKDVLK
jgi:hypothetical protein